MFFKTSNRLSAAPGRRVLGLSSSVVIWTAAVLIFIALGWFVMKALPPTLYPPIATPDISSAGLAPKELFDLETKRLELQGALRLTILQSLTVLVAASGAILAWQQARRQRQEKQQDFRLELFVEGMKALSDDSMAIRIGGIYTLERLAHSPEHRIASVEVLAAFLREHSQRNKSKDDDGISQRAPSLSTDAQKALDVLVHLRDREPLVLSNLNLTDAVLKKGAPLEQTDFTNTLLLRASMQAANLKKAILNHADLRHANLTEADLTDADLRNCTLSGADFSAATLNGADFSGATYTGWKVGPFDPNKHKVNSWPDGFEPAKSLDRHQANASTEG
jgi:hypothetical protein